MELTREQAIELACGIQGWMARDELGWLYDRAGEMPERGTWVEVGVWKGRSLLATALGASKGARIIGVDNFLGSPESTLHFEATIPGWLDECVGVVRKVVGVLRPDVSVAIAHQDSAEAAKELVRGTTTPPYTVFIDASHTYEAVKRDLLAWKGVIPRGGLLCGHDYCPAWPGVVRAVDECLAGATNPVGNIFAWRR